MPVLALCAVLAWFFMDNLPGQDSEPFGLALLKILGLHLLGLGNGAVFQMVPQVAAPGMASPTVGWISAVAAYGSFIIPAIFRLQVDAGAPQVALYPFTGFYGVCLVLNAWAFARR